MDGKYPSRRMVLAGLAGLAALSATGSGIAGARGMLTSKGPAYPWPYKKLDQEEVGRLAYLHYFKKWCSFTTFNAIMVPLRKRVGGPYRSFPVEAIEWAHGGIAGWGTACGTLIGAGLAVGLVAGEDAEKIVNDMMFWYSETELPVYVPEKVVNAEVKVKSKSNSPLCHISVGKWMSRANVGFWNPERIDRCARIAADVAMQTATRLNLWSEGKYKPEHELMANVADFGITAQSICEDCHGEGVVPRPPEMPELPD